MREEYKKILAACDHTLLKQDARPQDIKKLCDEAMEYGTASICIPTCYVKFAKNYVEDKMKICTVVGFPNGNCTSRTKIMETWEAIENGADEIDMVINIGMLKAGQTDFVRNEIEALKDAAGDKILKVIVETCMLTEEEKITACKLVTEAGADYIKTSTGFAGGGATFEDVKLFAENVGTGVKIKAAGGISSLEDAEKFMELGADRLGTSRIVKLVKEREA